ncbi:MAG: serine hydrolase [Thermanaerothrix sp.]|nr:serine hydrolase [Thermanaerothrix sp.]
MGVIRTLTVAIVMALSLLLPNLNPAEGGAPANAPGTINPSDFESFTRGLLEGLMRANHVPGAVFVAVHNDKVISCFGVGAADLAFHSPMTANSVVRTASISKVLTSLTVLTLCEQGKMSLDDDVNRYLKGISVPEAPWGSPVTIRNLLTHTGGFEDRWIGTEAEDPVAEVTFSKSLNHIMPRRVFPPGEVYCYSNYGMALAGAAAEKAARRNFQSLVKKTILTPLGMTQSGFTIDQPMERELATGYYSGPDPCPAQQTYFKEAPAISFCSTARDMGNLIRALLKDGYLNGRQVLPKGAVKNLLKPAFFNHPSIQGATLGMYCSRAGGVEGVEHGGDVDGFTSLLFLAPQRSFGFFVAFNGDVSSMRDHLKEALAERYLSGNSSAKPAAPSATPLTNQDAPQAPKPTQGHISGSYRHIRYSRSTVEKAYLMLEPPLTVSDSEDGTLTVSYPKTWDRGTQQFRPIGKDLFFSEDHNTYLAVRRDSQGKVKYLFIGDAYETYEPVPFKETPKATRALLWGFGLALLISAAMFSIGSFKAKSTRWYEEPIMWHRKWAWMLGFWILAWAFLLGLKLCDSLMGYSFRIGIPWQAKALFVMPFLCGLLLIPPTAALMRRPSDSKPFELPLFLLCFGLGAVFLGFLNMWNLLGFKF